MINSNKKDQQKRAVAEQAVMLVAEGMHLGLGTGSTMRYFIDALARRVEAGLKIRCTATSRASRLQATEAGIDIIDLDHLVPPDLTIDGADEIDPYLQLIKGGGGALLYEKIVAMASKRVVIIADSDKCVSQLGAFPLPIEVDSFAHATTAAAVLDVLTGAGILNATVNLRCDEHGTPFVTDGGHYIYDCGSMEVGVASSLSSALLGIAGVVEHGLFLDIADMALIARSDLTIEEIKR